MVVFKTFMIQNACKVCTQMKCSLTDILEMYVCLLEIVQVTETLSHWPLRQSIFIGEPWNMISSEKNKSMNEIMVLVLYLCIVFYISTTAWPTSAKFPCQKEVHRVRLNCLSLHTLQSSFTVWLYLCLDIVAVSALRKIRTEGHTISDCRPFVMSHVLKMFHCQTTSLI